MTRKARFEAIVRWFEQNAPNAQSELDFLSPYQLICAVILSAQCTDKRVNMVTPALFERFPDPQTLAAATAAEVYELIKSVSYPNSKAAHLVGMAQRLISAYGGEVPSDVDELMTLPGVGRKTANVVRTHIFLIPSIVVDTHVKRVSGRLGWTREADPVKIEYDLMKKIPEERWCLINQDLIELGRAICHSRGPKCGECFMADICPKTGVAK